MAHEPGGTWSKSKTKTQIKKGQLSTRTRSMAHQRGGPPVKSSVGGTVSAGE
jgi:hypothetical protein